MSRFLSSLWNPKYLIIISFFWFVSRFAFAYPAEFWGETARMQASHWSANTAFSQYDGYVSTLWGSVQTIGRFSETETERSESHKSVRVEWQGSVFKVPVFLKMKKSPNSNNIFFAKAPLMIVFPGIYSGVKTEHSSTLQHARMLNRLGYHALILPNSWSSDFISIMKKAKLNYKPGHMDVESDLYSAIIRGLEPLITPNVTSVSWMGFSYGTHLASSTLANLQAMQVSFNVPTTLLLISPPLDMQKSLNRLDQAMDESYEDYFSKGCSEYIAGLFRLGLNYFFARSGATLKPDSIRCAKSAVAQVGFQQYLSLTVQQLDLAIFSANQDRTKFRYKDYMNRVFPDVDATYFSIGKGKLSYYLSLLKDVKVLGISTQDDFLNTFAEWKEAFRLGEIDARSWLILKWGGHGGFFPTVEFESILKAQLN